MSHLRWCVLGNYNNKGGNRAGNIDFLETESEDSRDLSFFRETVGGKGNFSINWKFTLLNLVPSAFPLKNGSEGGEGVFPPHPIFKGKEVAHCCAQPKIFIIVALNEHITCRNLSQTS